MSPSNQEVWAKHRASNLQTIASQAAGEKALKQLQSWNLVVLPRNDIKRLTDMIVGGSGDVEELRMFLGAVLEKTKQDDFPTYDKPTPEGNSQ